MKKLIFLTVFLLAVRITYGQSKAKAKAPENRFTAQYAGYYGLGKNAEKERIASFIIYPETDSTVLFYFDSNVGPPSYNIGSCYGRLTIKGDTGIFYKKFDLAIDSACKWKFIFSKKKLVLQTMDQQYNCGLGHNVIADGEFKQESSSIIEECLDLSGQAINFRTLKPENYKNK
jgi:hypothetical protein